MLPLSELFVHVYVLVDDALASGAGFSGEVRRDWGRYLPRLPAQSEFNRRVRWLWGAAVRSST